MLRHNLLVVSSVQNGLIEEVKVDVDVEEHE